MINVNCLRGDAFIEKYLSDYEALRNLGYEDRQVRKMLAQLRYVQDYADTPQWLEGVDKIPKGTSWKDGQKYHNPGGKKGFAETYVFLLHENDLYIKDLLDKGAICHHTGIKDERTGVEKITYCIVRNRQICVIRKWKAYNAHKICCDLYFARLWSPFLESSILDFWHKNGGDVSLIEKKMLNRRERIA